MSKYEIDVCRISYEFSKVIIDASSEREATEVAIENAGDYLYIGKSSDYDVVSVVEIEKNA